MKLSACIDNHDSNENKESIEFLSHPLEEEKHSLLEHSIEVALKTKELLSYTQFKNSDLGFYSGLLHDIGKLNPYHQIFFRANKSDREIVKSELNQIFESVHSPYSAWIAEKLLEKKENSIDYSLLDKIIILIYGHHTKLRKSIGEMETSEKFKLTQQKIFHNLKKFQSISSQRKEFSELSWNNCFDRYLEPVVFDTKLTAANSTDGIDDFLEISVAYSCLLQADRGSFSQWDQAYFNQTINTSTLIKSESKLSSIREELQKELFANFEYDKPILILNAPTGIGKTKVFLDLVNRYKSRYNNLERIFYFSPLLALTDDFEKKFATTIENLEDILIYNHLFAGSLEEKQRMINESNSQQLYQQSQWIFNNESFNRPFIVTTTQRFLITIFSNRQSDKLKLSSFRNALLIIDEVQTIPKYILRSLICILERMYYFLGTRTILVSATIPNELRSIPITRVSDKLEKSYLNLTKKNISFMPWSNLDINKDRTLVMANTRRKAATIFHDLVTKFPDIMYLSSGIRKKDRIKIINQIFQDEALKKQFILVSTQVVEAGIDISFSQIFREMAPLDSVIQVMGRLNREAEDKKANLVVYEYDTEHRPYSKLELNESEKILRIVKDSTELYSWLSQYYQSISEKNNLYKKYTNELNEYIARLDFDEIWNFINKHVFLEEERDSVLVPDIKDWDNIKEILSKEKLTKNDYRMLSNISVSLPQSIHKLDIKDYFDEEIFQKNMLLPKKEYLDKVYDNRLGTDIWLIQ